MEMAVIVSSLFSTWQVGSLSCILIWIWASSKLNLTHKLRSFVRPWVARRVLSDTHWTLLLQSKHCGFFDHFFSVLSCVVSVPFYTGFLPLLFWSGHSKLGRQMTLLIAFADYVGNSLKDLVSAPRPSCPPVRRVIFTSDEEENAMEYGLPSSHALNTVCLSGYLLHYYLSYNDQREDITQILVGFTTVFMLIILIGLGRIYLGMHSLIDVISGVCIGVIILVIWLAADSYVDDFIVYGQNVTFFWAVLSVLLCFAYPKPELLTPSFDYHSAFSGVALGIGCIRRVSEEGTLLVEPMRVLKRRILLRKGRVVTQLLIQWQNGSEGEATWEDLYLLQHRYPHFPFLEDKEPSMGEAMIRSHEKKAGDSGVTRE